MLDELYYTMNPGETDLLNRLVCKRELFFSLFFFPQAAPLSCFSVLCCRGWLQYNISRFSFQWMVACHALCLRSEGQSTQCGPYIYFQSCWKVELLIKCDCTNAEVYNMHAGFTGLLKEVTPKCSPKVSKLTSLSNSQLSCLQSTKHKEAPFNLTLIIMLCLHTSHSYLFSLSLIISTFAELLLIPIVLCRCPLIFAFTVDTHNHFSTFPFVALWWIVFVLFKQTSLLQAMHYKNPFSEIAKLQPLLFFLSIHSKAKQEHADKCSHTHSYMSIHAQRV